MDISAVTDFLSQFEWDTLFQNKSLNDMISIFYDIVYLTIDIFVPLKKFLLKDFLFGSPRSLKIELYKKENT